MKQFKRNKYLLLFFTIVLSSFKESFGFHECPCQSPSFPTTSEVNNCVKLVAYLQAHGQSAYEWCSKDNNYKQCCLTCQHYKASCKNIAYDKSCDEKAGLGQCNQIMANHKPVSYFCQRSCNQCSVSMRCENLPNICSGGQCQNVYHFSQPSLQCVCPYNKGGAYCQQNNACLLSPCMNGGYCNPLYEQNTTYTCTCQHGFYGKNCQYKDNGCVNGKECANQGLCLTDFYGHKYCHCREGWTGPNCESYIGGCTSNVCLNGASCIPSIETPLKYYCVCKQDFTGYNCQTKLYTCSSVTCFNNGVCRESTNVVGAPYCECPSGYYGTYCEKKLDVCGSSPCKNNGKCFPSSGMNYVCICPANTYGKNCEFFALGCQNVVCKNGGTCYLNSLNFPVCSCRNGFSGQYCGETKCNSCLNGGTCIPYGSLHTCVCPANYVGSKCEYSLNCNRGDTNIMQCQSWSSIGFCNMKYTYNSMPVPVLCPISCNLCNLQCHDATSDCQHWALSGLCPSITTQNNGLCRKSCGQCHYPLMKKESHLFPNSSEITPIDDFKLDNLNIKEEMLKIDNKARMVLEKEENVEEPELKIDNQEPPKEPKKETPKLEKVETSKVLKAELPELVKEELAKLEKIEIPKLVKEEASKPEKEKTQKKDADKNVEVKKKEEKTE